jgi:hypothetical protein
MSGSTANTGLNVLALADNTYYRRAQGIDLNGNTGTWSSPWMFTIDTTLPTLAFTGVNPAANASRSGNIFTGQMEITELNLGQFIRSRNGTDYSVYDSGLVLMMNFDNSTSLGESGTLVKDLSQYGNNGTVIGATWTGNGKRAGGYQFNGSNNYINI